MAVIQGRTRAQLRQSIGYNLGALYVSSDSGSSSAATEIVDNTLIGANDNHNGKWVVFNDASGTAGQLTRVSDYDSGSTKLTVSPTLADTPVANDTYELWDDEYNPTVLNEFINQAIIEATGHAWDPAENPNMSSSPHTGLHSDGKTLRYDVPSGISMIQDVYYRNSVDFTRLHACAEAFDTNTASNFTVATDSKDKKQGTTSLKFTLDDATGVAAGAFLYDTITSKDISGYDYIEFWVKSSIGVSTAGNLKIHLDNGAITADGNDLESVDIPALSADTWTFVRAKLTNPEKDTAIVSIGLEQDADIGSGAEYFVWLDDISVVKNDTAEWVKIPRNLWRIDKEAKDVVFDSYMHGVARYSLLKIVGGDKPALLTSDSDTSEVSERYLIAAATARAYAASSGGSGTDPDQRRGQAGFWFGMANAAKRALPLLTNVRLVE
jgi:hypothetical protein